MALWTKVIAETFQLGGRIVLLTEKAPAELDQWLAPLAKSPAFASVQYSVADLVQGHYRTNSEDLVLFFPQQLDYLKQLDALLLGQRVLIASADSSYEDPRMDQVWLGLSLKDWAQGLSHVASNTGSLSVVSASDLKPCLFLDRDDVIIPNVPYNKEAAKVELMPGICELIHAAHAKGFWVSVVTNQSGLGRGWVQWSEYKEVHQQMLRLLAQQNCWLDESEWAAYIDEAPTVIGSLYSGLRKPRAGMFQKVQRKLNVHMPKSLMIGDSASDLIAAFSAGVGSLLLLKSEKMDQEVAKLEEYKKREPSFMYQSINALSADLLN